MAISVLPADVDPSIDSIYTRNSTKINMSIALPNSSATQTSSYARVGRIQSMNKDTSNNVQVLMEIGSQFAVELKKGISTYSFSVAKFYVRSDVFDQLEGGAVFSLQLSDAGTQATLEAFQRCALNTVSKSFTAGQATVAMNASVVVIGSSTGAPD